MPDDPRRINEVTLDQDLVLTGKLTALGGMGGPSISDMTTATEQANVKAQQAQATIGTLIADISNDNIITTGEKKELKRTWESIKLEYPKVLQQSDTRGIAEAAATRVSYVNAYAALLLIMETGTSPILANMDANSTIVGATFRAAWALYYETRQILMGTIEGETVGKTEFLTGFATGGGTLTPTAPTLAGSCLFQTAYLAWNAQSDLTGQITHKIYRADTAGGVYSLIATVSAYLYQDSNLALAGTESSPTARAYYYKVSRVVNGGTESTASNIVTVTANPIPAGSIAAASILAVKIDVDNLFAQKITIGAGGSIKAGTRYDDDGEEVDSAAAGLYMNSNGTFKARDANGAGIEIVPGVGATYYGTDITLTSSGINTTDQGGNKSIQELSSIIWRNALGVEKARIGFDTGSEKVVADRIYKKVVTPVSITLSGVVSSSKAFMGLHYYNGIIYCFYSSVAGSGYVYKYNVTTGAVTNGGEMPNITFNCSHLYNGKVYIFESSGTRLKIYDITTDTFSDGIAIPNYSRKTSQLANGKIYLFQDNGAHLEIYNIALGTMSEGAAIDTRYRTRASVLDNGIIYNFSAGETVEIYNIQNNTVQYGELLGNNAKETAALFNGKVYLPADNSTTLEIYDIASNTVAAGATLANRYRRISAIYQGKLYLPQYSGTGLEVYDIDTNTVSSGGTITNDTIINAIVSDGKLYISLPSTGKFQIIATGEYDELGAGIIERGSNANGHYIKFSDGTMVCRYQHSSTTTTSSYDSSNGFFGNLALTFPAPFKTGTVPIVSDATLLNGGATVGAHGYQTSNTGTVMYLHGYAATNNAYIGYIAWGYWK